MITASFYDLATSISFCVNSAAMSGDPNTKTGREVYCLERILRQCAWQAHVDGQPLNLIDLGSGSGHKALRILESAVADAVRPISYFPIDASHYCSAFAILTVLNAYQGLTDTALKGLLDSSPEFLDGEWPNSDLPSLATRMVEHQPRVSTVAHQHLTVPSRGLIADFIADVSGVVQMVRTSPAYAEGVSVYTLLGQTLGNNSSADRQRFLTQLCAAMSEFDILLIDAGLPPEDGDTADLDERWRNLEIAYAREAWFFMRHKADDRSSRFRVAYKPLLRRIDHWFERCDGSAQDLGCSNFFTRSEVMSMLEGAGYRAVHTVSSLEQAGLRPGPECMVVMARKAS
jgi:hypothetical protein